MNLFPAIDLYEGKAVRLYKGRYEDMTVYSEDPGSIGEDFARAGASHIHIVDLEGAKEGTTPNFETVLDIKQRSGCFCEIGGGIRSMDVVKKYMDAGIDRVILGTAAVTDRAFLEEALAVCGDRIAVGVDIRDGCVSIKGWTQDSGLDAFDFCQEMQDLGVKTLIVTDISKDGAMKGTNRDLYRELAFRFELQITASGGVSDMEDVKALAELDLYGAIIGKAYYIGAIDLKEAVALAEGERA